MAQYFQKFPKVYYSLEEGSINPITVTDVTYPVNILEQYANDSKHFYTIIVKDGYKPEDIAYMVYGNSELHWIILKFNQILNPQFEWHLGQYNLDQFIANKYGSLANAQSEIHSYYKVVKYYSSTSETPHIEKIRLKSEEYANIELDLAGTTYNLANNETVLVITDRETLSMYDYEIESNEKRREVKLIQKEYVDSIVNSFNKQTGK